MGGCPESGGPASKTAASQTLLTQLPEVQSPSTMHCTHIPDASEQWGSSGFVQSPSDWQPEGGITWQTLSELHS
jgi:hypothetical protein